MREVIRVRKVEALVNLLLLKQINIPVFVFFSHRGDPFEQSDHFHVFDLINVVVTNFGNFLLLSDHYEVVAA